ncbi:hypothetical protein TrLO_g4792 [Triparma laevis f. longispina]|uniref:eIF3a PCI domain-containing protein n=1 Tax=Triparma laevis f. longispina TaxID=1714387 RepID=A0A9W7EF21_9STRA|nr:hypothetical protein TrLO_g4792 [Triparma laevis f. longispina]
MSYNANKPENALIRAKELVKIHQIPSALSLLYEVLIARKYKTWSLTYEQIALYYLDLCIEGKKSREVKDGLHQYRNLTQSSAPGSLEKVIGYLVGRAEQLVADAKAASPAETSDVTDLENSATPESILMSTMTSSHTSEVVQRETVLPALKFLWEVYRSVLDILKTHSRLASVYHATASAAFKFCSSNSRKTEFRRLCDMLRSHLSNLHKFGATAALREQNANKLKGWDGWTYESIEMHLNTRFEQLSVAGEMEQYSEGFRTVENIYEIMQLSRKQPRSKIMATYYEKLTNIFWVSGNHLFHSYAWYKYFVLCRDHNKSMTSETLTLLATNVLLSAMCIPSGRVGKKGDIVNTEAEEKRKEKDGRMANLLGFSSDPTRAALLSELENKGIIELCTEESRELYKILEKRGNPLTLVGSCLPLIQNIEEKFKPRIRTVVVTKLLKGLGAVYSTITIEGLMSLCEGLEMSFSGIEEILYEAVTEGLIKVRVDHRGGCLKFGAGGMESERLKGQLVMLAKALTNIVEEKINDDLDVEGLVEDRARFFAQVKAGLDDENAKCLERKTTIEKRKEEWERAKQAEEAKKEAERVADLAQKKKEAEERVKQEARNREKEKQIKIFNEMENTKKKALLAKLGKKLADYGAEASLAELDADALAREHMSLIQKKKDDTESKTKEGAKRLDYVTRAIRIEELPLREKQRQENDERLKKEHENGMEKQLKAEKQKWTKQSEKKKIFEAIGVFKYMPDFEAKIMAERKKVHEDDCKKAEEDAKNAAMDAKIERAKLARDDAIRQARDEEERKEREAKERKAAEAEQALRKKQEAEQAEKDSWITAGPTKTRGGGGGSSLPPPPSSGGGGMGAYRPPTTSSSGGGMGAYRPPGASQGGGAYMPPSARGSASGSGYPGASSNKYEPPSSRNQGGDQDDKFSRAFSSSRGSQGGGGGGGGGGGERRNW